MRTLFLGLLACCVSPVLFAKPALSVRAQKGPLHERVVLSGLVEPLHSMAVPVRWYGLIKKVPVQIGQEVKKGQLLGEVEMQYLEATSVYMKSRKSFLDTQLTQAKVDESLRLSQYQRQKGLAGKQIVSQSTVETAQMKLLESQLHRASVESALRTLKRETDENLRQLREANYYAPTDGVLTELLVDPKQLVGSFVVMQGQTFARVDKPGQYRIRATAVDTQAAFLKIGQTGLLTFEGTTQPIPCRISEIRVSADGAKDSLPLFEVVATFERPGALIHRGLLATMEIGAGSSPSAITIPWNAVQITPKGTLVSRVLEDGTTQAAQVTLGLRGRHRVEIVDGLKEGDEVEAELW